MAGDQAACHQSKEQPQKSNGSPKGDGPEKSASSKVSLVVGSRGTEPCAVLPASLPDRKASRELAGSMVLVAASVRFPFAVN